MFNNRFFISLVLLSLVFSCLSIVIGLSNQIPFLTILRHIGLCIVVFAILITIGFVFLSHSLPKEEFLKLVYGENYKELNVVKNYRTTSKVQRQKSTPQVNKSASSLGKHIDILDQNDNQSMKNIYSKPYNTKKPSSDIPSREDGFELPAVEKHKIHVDPETIAKAVHTVLQKDKDEEDK